MKKIILVLGLLLVLSINNLSQQKNFPIDIGNKWYYQAGSTRDDYYGVVKEVIDTSSSGFRKIISKYLYNESSRLETEYWAYIDGKFYYNNLPQLQTAKLIYDFSIKKDSCVSGSGYSKCWYPNNYILFNISDSVQIYKESGSNHSASWRESFLTMPKFGIVKYEKYLGAFPSTRYTDSLNLVGLRDNGFIYGDTTIFNTNLISQPNYPVNKTKNLPLTNIFKWNKAYNAKDHNLQISFDTLFINLISEFNNISDTSLFVTLNSYNSNYYWRILTNSNNGNTYNSKVYGFSTFDTEYVALPILPKNGAIINPFDITFTWNKVTYGVRYNFELARDVMFTDILITKSDIVNTFIHIDSLEYGRDYFWRIRTLNSFLNEFIWSDTYKISTINFPNEYSLMQNYPNPFNPITTIQFQLPSAGNVTLKVFDVLGSEVSTLVNEYREAGSYDVEFNASSLSSGVYYYQLTSGSFIQTHKMMLLK